jgi:hypothetical protein
VTTLKLFDNISRKSDILPKLGYGLFWLVLFVASLGASKNAHAAITCDASNTVTANVVVLDSPTVFNRLGAQNPNWITYALARDVVYVDWGNPSSPSHLKPITKMGLSMNNLGSLKGKVELRPDKRPRPLVIRSVAGSCLNVNFTNLLSAVANPNNARQGAGTVGFGEPNPNAQNPACLAVNGGSDPDTGFQPDGVTPFLPNDGVCLNADGDVVPDFLDAGVAFPGLENNDQVAGRCAGFHATGTELFAATKDDGSMVGENDGGGDTGDTNAGQPACGEGLAAPGEYREYNLITPHEGAFIINSYGATLGSESNSGNLGIGMFGALNVQPCGEKNATTGQCLSGMGARIYRSQVTEEELRLATLPIPTAPSCPDPLPDGFDSARTACNPGNQPIIDYEATYPSDCEGDPDAPLGGGDGVWCQEGKDGLPIINMLTADRELVHSDINAIIAGPNVDGTFPKSTYPLEGSTEQKVNPVYPNRLEAFREFTSQFHDEQTNSQVFPNWYNHPVMRHVVHGVKDQFMINYGSGGIGSEIISSRLRTGPMHDCTDCAYEEFFLASQTVGDPALLVNYPANTNIEACNPENIAAGPNDANSCWRLPNLANGPVQLPNPDCASDPDPTDLVCLGAGDPAPVIKAFVVADNYALFQEDPSNVHNAYTGDFVKMRNTHAGAFEQHIFHFHNHQWLFNPNDDNANYLDAQEIMPGSGHTYELVNGGAGNRNHNVGDAIFHCHFYPHFAQGMWYHMRNHDVYETGTVLAASLEEAGSTVADPGYHTQRWGLRSGKPAPGSRALPDGELPDGSPIPAIVPLPGRPVPHMPAKVEIVAVDRGGMSLLGGRTEPDGIPDSSQAIVDYTEAAGPDTIIGTKDDVSPGYPFWLAGNECGVNLDGFTMPGDRIVASAACPNGVAGQRMPTPPLDMLTNEAAAANIGNPNAGSVNWENLGGGWDGGLPRHALRGYASGGVSADTQNRLDFRKIVHMAQPVYFPETGTEMEQVSMAYQAVRHRLSTGFDTDGNALDLPTDAFVLNGAPPVPGGAYSDPCVDDTGQHLTAGTSGQWYSSNMPGPGEDRWDTLIDAGSSPYDSLHPRTYKLANLQIDAVFNKLGHHYAQERIIILWEDITDTVLKNRPPEPLVMRFNSFDCGKILHANLVPAEFEVDDFQVRTPTDIIGQHIHLPKWDLTTNDGAANGWNYEDGTLSPKMVVERIHAINHYNDLVKQCQAPGGQCMLPPNHVFTDHNNKTIELHNFSPINLTGLQPVKTLPLVDPVDGRYLTDPHAPSPKDAYFLPDDVDHYSTHINAEGNPQVTAGMYTGARTTIQRILVDPVLNTSHIDRGLGLTFSHDHYGPSTFQQIGLYSTILAEPAGSLWVHNESGTPLNTRDDGGPTTWQAAILTGADVDASGAPRYIDKVGGSDVPAHREFYFEMSDFQHAYNKNIYVGADADGIPVLTNVVQPNPFNATVAFAPAIQDTWQEVVNPTLKTEAQQFPSIVTAKGGCPGPAGNFDPTVPRPCAEAINIGHSSTWVINYRNEPVGYRVFDPNRKGPDGENGTQAKGRAGDLALAFSSSINRAIDQLNTRFGDSPVGYRNGADDYCQGNGQGDLINCDRGSGDPFTPIMRVYEGDQTKVKIQVGATEEQHQTTVHGIKWLSNGSGFGRSPNSGWRNFQSHGISEQFSLQAPLNPALRQAGQTVDYLYATDATRPGIWLGTWGILRTYGSQRQDLVVLPNNDISKGVQFTNQRDFVGVCPKTDPDGSPTPVRSFEIAAVLANDVLQNSIDLDDDGNGDITINANPQVVIDGEVVGGDSDNDGIGDNVGGPLDPNGGTLVYNRRTTVVADGPIDPVVQKGGAGPLNDPTAMMYVRMDDLVPVVEYQALVEKDPYWAPCTKQKGKNGDLNFNPGGAGCPAILPEDCKLNGTYKSDLPTCPHMLKADAPVEPLVLRANAGDCIEVQLRNRLVTRQGVTKDTGEKVYYGSGWPAMHDDGKGDTYYAGSATGRQVYLDNIEFFGTPDLAGWQDMMWGVKRRIQGVGVNAEMHFFNNNLVRPGGYAGIHAQLVEYDASRDDGLWVGQNQQQVASPGGVKNFRYYAGHLEYVPCDPDTENCRTNRREFTIVATPVEFGGSNLLSADRIKQPQKGLFGALVIEPQGAGYPTELAALEDVPDGQGSGSDTRKTRAQISISAEGGGAGSGGNYRETIAVAHKIANLRWADGSAIKNVAQEEMGVEGAEDSGHAGFNYGMEPAWFRFGLPPNVPFGNAGCGDLGTPNECYGDISNPQAFYANNLVLGKDAEGNPIVIDNAIPEITVDDKRISAIGDPQTPVFRAPRGMATRMHVLNGASADRDSTYILHGHVWQRDPYVCPDDSRHGLPGLCMLDSVGSLALGKNPVGKYMGSEEGMGHVYGHWPILFDAGGSNAVPGDYLYRDYAPNGNRNGMFGILRVE